MGLISCYTADPGPLANNSPATLLLPARPPLAVPQRQR
jgi:hypothetical protein